MRKPRFNWFMLVFWLLALAAGLLIGWFIGEVIKECVR